jgi:outer membrane protein assembly factor BamB
MCLNRQDGKTLWLHERTIEKVPAYEHAAGDPANSTPATDGENVVFYFDDYGVIVTDLKGHIKWEKTMPTTSNTYSYGASPLAYRDRVYMVATGGFVTCVDLNTGKPYFEKERLRVPGEYYASPLAVGDHILICSQRGTVFLIKAADQLEIEHRTDLKEKIFATPAIVDNKIYLRSENHIWAFGK